MGCSVRNELIGSSAHFSFLIASEILFLVSLCQRSRHAQGQQVCQRNAE
jgi:hypothetical protein